MRRYNGNTGRYEYMEDQPRRNQRNTPQNHSRSQRQPEMQKPVQPPPPQQNTLSHDMLGGLQKTLSNLFSQGFENEDLLLFAVLFLMYQETKDKELLIIMGGMFLL